MFLDPVTKTRLAGLMQAADLGLMTLQNVPAFYRGTSPNKFFDFIAAGKPVINNYPGWLADMISSRAAASSFRPTTQRPLRTHWNTPRTHRDEVLPHGTGGAALAREEFDRDLLARPIL